MQRRDRPPRRFGLLAVRLVARDAEQPCELELKSLAPLSISYSGMHVDESVRYRFASDVLDAAADGRFDDRVSRAFIRCLGLSDVVNGAQENVGGDAT